jgi:hypothetical protein
VYAFIEKEKCSKEEKAFGQSWEITQISYSVFTRSLSFISCAVNWVNLFGKRKIVTAGLENLADDAAGRT